MACHLFAANPLSDPMLAYCELSLWEHSVKDESKYEEFHSRKLRRRLNVVCKMVPILFPPQCVNFLVLLYYYKGISFNLSL